MPIGDTIPLFAACHRRGSRAPVKWWNYSGLERSRSEARSDLSHFDPSLVVRVSSTTVIRKLRTQSFSYQSFSSILNLKRTTYTTQLKENNLQKKLTLVILRYLRQGSFWPLPLVLRVLSTTVIWKHRTEFSCSSNYHYNITNISSFSTNVIVIIVHLLFYLV